MLKVAPIWVKTDRDGNITIKGKIIPASGVETASEELKLILIQ